MINTDDIALAVEIPGIYDGTCLYLMKDGRIVNRFTISPGWDRRRIEGVNKWIAEHGDKLRAQNADLLTTPGDDYPEDDWAAS